MHRFSAIIRIIGVNPYVFLPSPVLKELRQKSGKSKGPVPVKGRLNGKPFVQTLVKYGGRWRLYLNTPMRTAAHATVGDTVQVQVALDGRDRTVPLHAALKAALAKNKRAKAAYDVLPPSRKKEINRYLAALKTDDSVRRNVKKAIAFLAGKKRFIGRDPG